MHDSMLRGGTSMLVCLGVNFLVQLQSGAHRCYVRANGYDAPNPK